MPILSTQEIRSTIVVNPGSYNGILIRTKESEGALLIRLKAELVEDLTGMVGE